MKDSPVMSLPADKFNPAIADNAIPYLTDLGFWEYTDHKYDLPFNGSLSLYLISLQRIQEKPYEMACWLEKLPNELCNKEKAKIYFASISWTAHLCKAWAKHADIPDKRNYIAALEWLLSLADYIAFSQYLEG